jgi:hypothetical protein
MRLIPVQKWRAKSRSKFRDLRVRSKSLPGGWLWWAHHPRVWLMSSLLHTPLRPPPHFSRYFPPDRIAIDTTPWLLSRSLPIGRAKASDIAASCFEEGDIESWASRSHQQHGWPHWRRAQNFRLGVWFVDDLGMVVHVPGAKTEGVEA